MINCEAKQYLLDLYREHNIMLEGNILKIITIDENEDIEFKEPTEEQRLALAEARKNIRPAWENGKKAVNE